MNWEIKRVEVDHDSYEADLAIVLMEGWEPFSAVAFTRKETCYNESRCYLEDVFHEVIWLRRQA